MKKLLFTSILFALLCVIVSAQDLSDTQKAVLNAANTINDVKEKAVAPVKPNYWKNSYTFTLGFNQTFLSNWAAGGYNTLSLAAGIDARANYAKELSSWNNRLQLDYAFLWSADKKNLLQKSNDRIYLESSFAYKTAKESKWSYNAGLDFRSQFSDTYDNYKKEKDDQGHELDSWTGTLKSGFMSPAYTNIALGMEWKPNNWFDLSISPLTGGFTIVTRKELRDDYGMKISDATKNSPEYIAAKEAGEDLGRFHRPFLFQFGTQIKANAGIVINEAFKFDTQLVLFYDYLYDYKSLTDADLRFPIRVNWDNNISWQVTKFFKLAFQTWLIYDPNVRIYSNPDKSDGGRRSKLQFKEFFSINFVWSISNGKK